MSVTPRDIARIHHAHWDSLRPIDRARFIVAINGDKDPGAAVCLVMHEQISKTKLPRPTVEEIQHVLTSQWAEFKAWQQAQKLN